MTQSEPLTISRECPPVVDAKHTTESDRSVAETLLDALAEAADVDVTALPPLYESIDLEAVTQLFDTHEGVADSTLLLGFEFRDWKLYVRGDGRIRICDTTKPIAPTPVFENFPVGAGAFPRHAETS